MIRALVFAGILIVSSLGCGGGSSGDLDGGSGRDAGTPIDAGSGGDAGALADGGGGSRDAGLPGADAGKPSDGGLMVSDAGPGSADGGAGAAGFEGTHHRWGLPPTGLDDGFFFIGWSIGQRYWTLLDLDGDGRLDLAHTADSSNPAGVVWSDGSGPYWKVYFNSGSAFVASPARWTVPSSGQSDGFFSGYWSTGQRYWMSRDLDGDGKADLVHTADSSNPAGVVWSDGSGPYWKVYRSNGSGFPTSPTRWIVPASGQSDGFFSGFWSFGQRYWTTIDMDGDGRPDLVHTADSSNTSGVVWTDGSGPYWKVYLNTGSAFATSASRWTVPSSGQSDGFFAAAWSAGQRYWATFDLTGDGRPDLVHTADSSDPAGVVWSDGAGSYWKVYVNTGAGFATSPVRWPVPQTGQTDGFFVTAWASGQRYWTTIDVDGDRRPDLVHTADASNPSGLVWTDGSGAYWRVHRNTGSGFSGAPTRWAVPPSGLSDGFFTTGWASGSRYWATFDLDGDLKADLIHTADSADTSGKVWSDGSGPFWRVFRGR